MSSDLTLALSDGAPLTQSSLSGGGLLKKLATTSNSRPVAVAAAYINGDNRKDLVVAQSGVVNQTSGTLGVGIHYQELSIHSQTLTLWAPAIAIPLSNTAEPYPVPVDLEIADFDGDTLLDIATANQKTGDLRILENIGSLSSFPLHVIPALAGDLRGLAVDDFDPHDHTYYAPLGSDADHLWYTNLFPQAGSFARPDIATISETEDMAFVLLNESTGDGSFAFSSVRRFPVGDAPQAIMARDVTTTPMLNSDGTAIDPPPPTLPKSVDLIVVNRDSSDASILIGRGMDRALFDPAHRVAVGKSPRDLAIANLDWIDSSSTIVDIVTSNRTDRTVTVLQGNGVPAGGFTLLLGRRPTEAGTNGPGAASGEVLHGSVLGNFGGGGAGEPPDVVTFAGALAGLGSFENKQARWIAYRPTAAGGLESFADGTVGSVSGTKRPVVLRAITGDFFVAHMGTPRADRLPMSERRIIAAVSTPQPPSVGDFTSISDPIASGAVVLIDPSVEPDGVTAVLPAGYGASSLTAGDFVGDGFHSIAVTNAHDHSITLLRNSPAPGGGRLFLDAISIATAPNVADGLQPRDIVTADYDGDGKLDLLVANTTSSTLTLLRGLAPGNPASTAFFGTPLVVAAYDSLIDPRMKGPIALLAEDFNGDGKTDIAVANYRTSSVSVLLNATQAPGAPAFSAAVTDDTGRAPVRLAYGDVTGDGIADIVVANSLTSSTWPVTDDLFAHEAPKHVSYSSDGRFMAFVAPATPEAFNVDPPSTPRIYVPRLFVVDRLGGCGPKRPLSDDYVVVDCFFQEPSAVDTVQRLAFVRRDSTDPLNANKEKLYVAIVEP